jgi:hypothetical protein
VILVVIAKSHMKTTITRIDAAAYPGTARVERSVNASNKELQWHKSSTAAMTSLTCAT